jgi:hypothetical protein
VFALQNDGKDAFLVDFQFYNYNFCREQNFNASQTSVFLGICLVVIQKDLKQNATSSNTSLEESFQSFQQLVLTHSVERSPQRYFFFLELMKKSSSLSSGF